MTFINYYRIIMNPCLKIFRCKINSKQERYAAFHDSRSHPGMIHFMSQTILMPAPSDAGINPASQELALR
jgi:hypothetical protein